MSTYKIELSDDDETLIAKLLQSGRYKNADDILYDGLRLIEAREALAPSGRQPD